MPGLQDWPADPRTGPHCRGLRVLTGAYDCRYLMITVSKPSTKPLTGIARLSVEKVATLA